MWRQFGGLSNWKSFGWHESLSQVFLHRYSILLKTFGSFQVLDGAFQHPVIYLEIL